MNFKMFSPLLFFFFLKKSCKIGVNSVKCLVEFFSSGFFGDFSFWAFLIVNSFFKMVISPFKESVSVFLAENCKAEDKMNCV